MTDVPPNDAEEPGEDEAASEVVERERSEVREFVKTLSGDDIKSGNWFEKLLTQSLRTYTTKGSAARSGDRWSRSLAGR